MTRRLSIVLALPVLILLACLVAAEACCPVASAGKPVLNADQTVIILWDPATRMQHFIRQASFQSDADDFGFLVPSPSQPELEESGDAAFAALRKLTEPEVQVVTLDREVKSAAAMPGEVKVLEEKRVAGFQAAVLEAKSATSLIQWLEKNGYAFSPEVEAWARPYVEAGWKITALKLAKDPAARARQSLTAAALRLSFKTDQPLFPYREPDFKSSLNKGGTHHRLLRIYFLSDGRYQGALTPKLPWSGKVVWAGKVSADDRKTVLDHLKLPQTAGPTDWYLTEFEDDWPYTVAPADVTFSRDPVQRDLKREPITRYRYTTAPGSNSDQNQPSSSFVLSLLVGSIAVGVALVVVLALIAYRWLGSRKEP